MGRQLLQLTKAAWRRKPPACAALIGPRNSSMSLSAWRSRHESRKDEGRTWSQPVAAVASCQPAGLRRRGYAAHLLAAGYGTLTGGTRNWNWGWWFGFCFWFWFFMWHVVFQQPQPPLSCLVY